MTEKANLPTPADNNESTQAPAALGASPNSAPIGRRRIKDLSKEELAEAFAPMIRQFEPQIKSFMVNLSATLNPLVDAFRNFGPVLIDIAKAFERLPEVARASVYASANEGWFYDPQMEIDRMIESGKHFLEGKKTAGDELLSEHFRGRLDKIEAGLVARLPERERFFRQAFAAHRGEQFALCIPLLLAQADGASRQLREGHFFLSKKKNPNVRDTAQYATDRDAGEFDRIALLALIERLPILTQLDKLPPEFSEINRHSIMHGSSLDYDTERNSLKAISLLNYVVLGVGDELTIPPAST